MTAPAGNRPDCGHPNHGNPDHDCKPFLPVAAPTEDSQR